MESKSMGFAAIDRAKETINAMAGTKIERPHSQRLADREWFERNRAKVERMIKGPFGLDKKQFLGKDLEIQNKREQPQEPRNPGDDLASYYAMDLGSYQPVIDDDAEVYIPISER